MRFFKLNEAPSLSPAALILPDLLMSSAIACDLNEKPTEGGSSPRSHLLSEQQAEDEKSPDLLSRLPKEMACEVISYLSREDLGRLACVSKGWQALTKENMYHYSLHDKDAILKAPKVSARNIVVQIKKLKKNQDFVVVQRDVQYGPYKVRWQTDAFFVDPEPRMEILEQNLDQKRWETEICVPVSIKGIIMNTKKKLLPDSIEGLKLPEVGIEEFRNWAEKYKEAEKTTTSFQGIHSLILNQEGSLLEWRVNHLSIKKEEEYQMWRKVRIESVNRVFIDGLYMDGKIFVSSPMKSLRFSKVIPMGDGMYGICEIQANIDLRHFLCYSWCK